QARPGPARRARLAAGAGMSTPAEATALLFGDTLACEELRPAAFVPRSAHTGPMLAASGEAQTVPGAPGRLAALDPAAARHRDRARTRRRRHARLAAFRRAAGGAGGCAGAPSVPHPPPCRGGKPAPAPRLLSNLSHFCPACAQVAAWRRYGGAGGAEGGMRC